MEEIDSFFGWICGDCVGDLIEVEDGLEEGDDLVLGLVPHGGADVDARHRVGGADFADADAVGDAARHRVNGTPFVQVGHVAVLGQLVGRQFQFLGHVVVVVAAPVHRQRLVDQQRVVEGVREELLRRGQTLAARPPDVQRDPALRVPKATISNEVGLGGLTHQDQGSTCDRSQTSQSQAI